MDRLISLPPELLHMVFNELMISYARDIDLSLFAAGDVCRTFRDVAITIYFRRDSLTESKTRTELWHRMGEIKRLQLRLGEMSRREGYRKRSVSARKWVGGRRLDQWTFRGTHFGWLALVRTGTCKRSGLGHDRLCWTAWRLQHHIIQSLGENEGSSEDGPRKIYTNTDHVHIQVRNCSTTV